MYRFLVADCLSCSKGSIFNQHDLLSGLSGLGSVFCGLTKIREGLGVLTVSCRYSLCGRFEEDSTQIEWRPLQEKKKKVFKVQLGQILAILSEL